MQGEPGSLNQDVDRSVPLIKPHWPLITHRIAFIDYIEAIFPEHDITFMSEFYNMSH